MIFQADTVRQIKQPQEEYKKFVQTFFGPFGASLVTGNDSNCPADQLNTESKALLIQLEDKVKKRKELLSNKLPNQLRDRIRLKEEDLKILLHQGTLMVEKFYSEDVIKRMTETEVKNFWFTKGLKASDWLGLTSFLLSELFTPEFMIPLQEVDTTFALKVRHFSQKFQNIPKYSIKFHKIPKYS